MESNGEDMTVTIGFTVGEDRGEVTLYGQWQTKGDLRQLLVRAVGMAIGIEPAATTASPAIGNPPQERPRSHIWARHPDAPTNCLRCGLIQNAVTLVDGCRDYWTEHDWPDAVPGVMTRCRRCGCDKVPSGAVPERCVAQLDEFTAESVTWPLAHHWEGPWEPGGNRQCTNCGLSDTLDPAVPKACRGHWTGHDIIGTRCRRCNTAVPVLTVYCTPVRSYRISER